MQIQGEDDFFFRHLLAELERKLEEDFLKTSDNPEINKLEF